MKEAEASQVFRDFDFKYNLGSIEKDANRPRSKRQSNIFIQDDVEQLHQQNPPWINHPQYPRQETGIFGTPMQQQTGSLSYEQLNI